MENTAGNDSTNQRAVSQIIELVQAGELKVNWAEYLKVWLNQVMDHQQHYSTICGNWTEAQIINIFGGCVEDLCCNYESLAF